MFITACTASGYANETPPITDESQSVEEVVAVGVRQRLYQAGALMDAIQKTEVIDEHIIEARQAVNLSQAIAASPGVRVSNECSMCGVKRIMLNGMRGEHTTILTDGVPLHTMLAGYYAVDAIATTGVERIEVARGAGASLIAPEAIGGTINVVSKEPDRTGLEINGTFEEGDGYLISAMGTLVSDDGRLRTSLVTQFDRHDKVDADDNGVSEAPLQDNRNVILRVSGDPTDRDNLTFRGAYIDSEIFGGTMVRSGIDSLLRDFDGTPAAQMFQENDVRKQFTGKPWETTEWIDTERMELTVSWLHEFGDRFNATLTGAYSQHDQESFYEGFDYAARDKLTYLDLRNNYILNANHLLTFGVDRRDEQMRSHSLAGDASDNYIEDSFDYRVTGFYLQDAWLASDALEVALAVRIDNVEADFVTPEKPGTEIEQTLISPRIDAQYRHTDQLSSRVSLGIGYRAPLSFFETDHGILDAGDGFAIDVDDLERSKSATYALSFEGNRLTSTLSMAYTRVDNLSSVSATPGGVPLLTQLDDSALALSSDLALGYKLTDSLTLGATLEHFDYDRNFERAYAIAPIEDRLTLTADYENGRWNAYATAVWTGSRDLSRYGYEGRNILGESLEKSTSAQAYWTLDVRLSRDIGDHLSVYLGAYNLFDKTQAGDMQTPLFWDSTGSYDVGYIYGPLRGREIYAGVKFEL
ncbi:MAG: TonB-dependent receptor [Pseudomonadales bacterium]|nr:TonB-dependent receptor [Pseudomonadales bacterium]